MIAQIIPLLKLPRSTTTFDYLVPSELESQIKIGHLVSVPFRQRRGVRGAVLDLKEKPFRRGLILKSIKKIIIETPLPLVKLRLTQWMANYYHCSLGTAGRIVLG